MRLTEYLHFLSDNRIYAPSDIETVIAKINDKQLLELVKKNKTIQYYNIPVSFDIETSSFFRSTGNSEQEKVSIMYEWSFCICGLVIIGRTWDEYFGMLSKLRDLLQISANRKLVIYVHNLAFEFQYIRFHCEWEKVFSIKKLRPVYAITKSGFEYRCSYILSGYSLENLSETLTVYKISKLVGELDYNLLRTSKTPLSLQELAYCINDVKIIIVYILECIQNSGSIIKIPLTKTGYAREYCRNICFNGISLKNPYNRYNYRQYMDCMQLDVQSYDQLKRAFQGGFTHANPFYSDKTVHNVSSLDICSSYPAVLVCEQFPISSPEHIDIHSMDEFEKNLSLYCCCFDIEFNNIHAKNLWDNYISISRCYEKINYQANNGRLVKAERIKLTVTETDYQIIKNYYEWDYKSTKVINFTRYKRGYLPKEFVYAVLSLYAKKTELKDVEGRESEYQQVKELLNSLFGMSVTDIVRELIVYTDDWKEPEIPDKYDAINKYNNNYNRFLYYAWGVWVTAYARRNLFIMISEFGYDYIYSDTDSVKAINYEKHKEFVDKYNKVITSQIERALNFHKLNKKLAFPKTNDGITKPLGVWEYEAEYECFKTLGAKRYLVKYSNSSVNKAKKRGTYLITISGVSKVKGSEYLVNKYKTTDKIFAAFKDGLVFPGKHTGKLTLTYLNDRKTGKCIDYIGNECEYDELSGVHMEEATYKISISSDYLDYLLSIHSDQCSG